MGATRLSCMIMFILAGASFLSSCMAFTGIPRALAEWVRSLAPHQYTLIAILAGIYILLGTALDGVSMIVLTTSIVIPMVEKAGFDLVWFGIFIVLLVEIAELTPPLGFNIFVLQTMTGRDSNYVALASLPFFFMMVLCIALITVVPRARHLAARHADRRRQEVASRVRKARDTLTVTLTQRCFYLFAALLLVIMAVPFLEGTPRGRIVLNLINMTVMIAAIIAFGRSLGALFIGLLLALPTAACMVIGQLYEARGWVILSNAFAATFYFITVSYLLSYSLRRDVLTMDKLYGAAAVFLMLGAVWMYFYFIVLWFYPGRSPSTARPSRSCRRAPCCTSATSR